MDYNEFLRFGDSVIQNTRRIVLDLWHKNSFKSELKEDQTPVSEVDLKCEELVRSLIAKSYPSHGIIGEEHGAQNSEAEFVWTIDPIDGTQNLINRIPTFGTILALLHNGKPVLGWIDHPVLDIITRGGKGVGITQNNREVALADICSEGLTPNDIVATNQPSTFDFGGHRPVLDTILNWHPQIRMYYDVYSHTLATQGSLAVMIEYNLKIWDIAATEALINEAGGSFALLGVDKSHKDGFLRYHAAFGKKRAVSLAQKFIPSTGSAKLSA